MNSHSYFSLALFFAAFFQLGCATAPPRDVWHTTLDSADVLDARTQTWWRRTFGEHRGWEQRLCERDRAQGREVEC